MVDNIVYLLGIELMEDGHGNGSVGQRCQKGHGPVSRVSSADSYLVALLHVTVLEQDVQLFDFPGYVVEL